MTQHDFNIANQGMPAARTDVNNALAALASNSSGTSAPSSPTTNQFWLDTNATPYLLKFYDGTDWITIGAIDATANDFQPYVGTTEFDGGFQKIDVQTASASSSLDFTTGITSAYDLYRLVLANILPATDGAALWTRIAEDTVPNIKSGVSDYEYSSGAFDSSAAALGNFSASQGAAQIVACPGIGNAAGEGVSGYIDFFAPAATANHNFSWSLNHFDKSATAIYFNRIGGGSYNGSTNAIQSVQLLMSSGNIASGAATLYGLRK